MQIYADFNSLESCHRYQKLSCLDLTGYGTLASLNLYQLSLKIGEELLLVDPSGLFVQGQAFFDKDRVSKTCSGWFAKFERSAIAEGVAPQYDYSTHLCFNCRSNIKPYLDKVGRNFREECPFCGTSVMFALLPPK
jgi:hypothetical protein